MLKFLEGGLPIVQGEPGTTRWFALRFGPSSFGIFDTFPGEAGRQAGGALLSPERITEMVRRSSGSMSGRAEWVPRRSEYSGMKANPTPARNPGQEALGPAASPFHRWGLWRAELVGAQAGRQELLAFKQANRQYAYRTLAVLPALNEPQGRCESIHRFRVGSLTARTRRQ